MTTEFILKSASDEQLGLAVEENVFAMFNSMTEVLNGEIEENPQLSRFRAAPRSPIFKGANRTKLTSDETDMAIRETITNSTRVGLSVRCALRPRDGALRLS